jgi:hypothetical protein
MRVVHHCWVAFCQVHCRFHVLHELVKGLLVLDGLGLGTAVEFLDHVCDLLGCLGILRPVNKLIETGLADVRGNCVLVLFLESSKISIEFDFLLPLHHIVLTLLFNLLFHPLFLSLKLLCLSFGHFLGILSVLFRGFVLEDPAQNKGIRRDADFDRSGFSFGKEGFTKGIEHYYLSLDIDGSGEVIGLIKNYNYGKGQKISFKSYCLYFYFFSRSQIHSCTFFPLSPGKTSPQCMSKPQTYHQPTFSSNSQSKKPQRRQRESRPKHTQPIRLFPIHHRLLHQPVPDRHIRQLQSIPSKRNVDNLPQRASFVFESGLRRPSRLHSVNLRLLQFLSDLGVHFLRAIRTNYTVGFCHGFS